jgi:hypothetical protein
MILTPICRVGIGIVECLTLAKWETVSGRFGLFQARMTLQQRMVLHGRCSMDYCSFTEIVSIWKIARNHACTLLSVEERRCGLYPVLLTPA